MSVDADLWGWAHGYYWNAAGEGNTKKLRVSSLHYEAWRKFEHNPDEALATLDEGLLLAQELNESWWTVFYNYWRTEAFVFYIGDMNKGLDLAVRNAVEVRKPSYLQYPGVGRVYRVLLDAYVFRDPIGYEDKINETIETMENDIPLDSDTRYLLQARRSQMDYIMGRKQSAKEKAQVYLAMCEGSAFRLMHAYELLCDYAYNEQEYEQALAYAIEMEEQSRRCGKKSGIVVAYEVRAVIARKQGYEDEAREHFRIKLSHESHLGTKRGSFSYDLMCEYHELGGESDKSWALREKQLEEVVGKGFFYEECWIRLKRCRLLGRMGKPIDDELKETHLAAEKLLKPQLFLEKVKKVENGDFSEIAE